MPSSPVIWPVVLSEETNQHLWGGYLKNEWVGLQVPWRDLSFEEKATPVRVGVWAELGWEAGSRKGVRRRWLNGITFIDDSPLKEGCLGVKTGSVSPPIPWRRRQQRQELQVAQELPQLLPPSPPLRRWHFHLRQGYQRLPYCGGVN